MHMKDFRHEDLNRVILFVRELEGDMMLARLTTSGVTSGSVRPDPADKLQLKFPTSFPSYVCPTCKQRLDLAVVTCTIGIFFCPPRLGYLRVGEARSLRRSLQVSAEPLWVRLRSDLIV